MKCYMVISYKKNIHTFYSKLKMTRYNMENIMYLIINFLFETKLKYYYDKLIFYMKYEIFGI